MTTITAEKKKSLKRSASVRKGKRQKALELDEMIAAAVAKERN